MRSSTYEKIKDTPIVSTLPDGPIIDIMEVLMNGIIKRKEKWVEWTGARRNRTRATSSSSRVASWKTQSLAVTSTTVARSTLVGPTQSIGGGGDQPPKNNIQVPPSYGGCSLPDTGKFGVKEVEKEKENEKKKSLVMDSSHVLVIKIDGDNNPLNDKE